MVSDNQDKPKRIRLFGRRAKPAVTDAAASAPTAPADADRASSDAVDPATATRPVGDVATKEAPVAEHETTTPEPVESDEIQAAESAPAPVKAPTAARGSTTALLFQAPDLPPMPDRPERAERQDYDDDDEEPTGGTTRRRRRGSRQDREEQQAERREQREQRKPEPITEPQRIKGSTRLESKKQRRRDGRDAGRRRTVVTESEFLARRESVDRTMVVRAKHGRTQIAVLEDSVLVEHYVARSQEASLIGNVYLGRVQNVLPSMEAAFVDIGRGRNAVLYSGEVDWDAAAAENDGKPQARRIELALKPGDRVLVQVTKDPVGHKGARLTSQISLPGRYLVYVPNGSMSGISRKLPDTERSRLKKILKEVLPESAGVIVRTAAEGATEEQLTLDVNRLTSQWEHISGQVEKANAPALLHSEPDLLIKIIRDVFNEDFEKLVIEGDDERGIIESYLRSVAPDLIDRVQRHEGERDSFDQYRVSEQIEKALDRKVWLPSGGSLVIDRTEAMTVVDVNTGKFVGSGGNLEETVTKNNLEAAEEIVRQLRLRDIGGIIVVDFIDMVLEVNRDLVLRRLVECLSRDRTKHQVAEVTSLGLVQMTRKKVGLGLLETFSEPCEQCAGRGVIVHHDPVTKHRGGGGSGGGAQQSEPGTGRRNRNKGGASGNQVKNGVGGAGTHAITEDVRNALARVAKSTVQNGDAESAPSAPEAPVSVDEPKVAPEQQPEQTEAERPKSRSRRSRSRGSSGNQDAGTAETSSEAPAAPAEPAAESVEQVSVVAAEAAVNILDIPVEKASQRKPKISTADAEQILDSVLGALPEPKQAGQGRGRGSRRASSPIITPPQS